MKKPVPLKVKKLMDPCKHVAPETKKLFLPLFNLACEQHHKIKELENEIKSLRQPTMFTSPYPEGSHVSKSFIREPEPPPEELDVWMRRQFENGAEETEAFKRFLRYRKLSIEDARAIAFKKD